MQPSTASVDSIASDDAERAGVLHPPHVLPLDIVHPSPRISSILRFRVISVRMPFLRTARCPNKAPPRSDSGHPAARNHQHSSSDPASIDESPSTDEYKVDGEKPSKHHLVKKLVSRFTVRDIGPTDVFVKREKHITSLGLEKMVMSIKEKKMIEPLSPSIMDAVPKSSPQTSTPLPASPQRNSSRLVHFNRTS